MKSKKMTITIIMLTIIAAFISFTSWSEAAQGNDYIKVGLKYGSSSITSCNIKSDAGFQLIVTGEDGFVDGMPLPAYTSLTITSEYGAIVIRDEGGTLLSADLGTSGCIMPANYDNQGIIYLDGTPYRGGIMFYKNSNGTLVVINYISMEHYVYGVVNSELGHGNPAEALKAQAVAARSFGAYTKGKHKADGFDVCATTHCQVYKGYSGEYTETNLAVDETIGEVLYSEGTPVNAYYFKNSGGYTQNSEDVWTYKYPYLKSVKDEYSPSYPWNASFTYSEIGNKLEAAGYNPGKVQSVNITSRSENGYVSELEITGSNSTISLKKEKIRSVFGSTVLKSLNFGLGGEIITSGDSTIVARGKSATADLGSDVYMMSGSGNVSKDKISNIYGSNGTVTIKLKANTSSGNVATGETVDFRGYGYGHGVGMPQDSAIEMAKQGLEYDEILEYFYADIDIK